MLEILTIVLIIAVAALLWRVRGGWLNVGSSTLGRLIPATWLACGAWWLTQDLWLWLLLPLIWLGTILPWANWMDMAAVNGKASDDLTGMTGRGLLLTWPAGLLLYFMDYGIIFLAGGVLMGPIYWSAWRFLPSGFGVPPRLFGMIDGPTAIAELGVGAMLGALLVMGVA